MNYKRPFYFPMSKTELIIGILYIPFHIIIIPVLVSVLNLYLTGRSGVELSDAYLNVICYTVSFLFVVLILFRFLRASFSDLCDNLLGSLRAVIMAYLFSFIALIGINYILILVLGQVTNPNSEQIINEAKQNANVMFAVTVLLAPLVEEALFRGVIFGSIRKRSRVAAYLVSTVIFAAYHLWSYFFVGFDWKFVFYLLEYVPGSIALAWCYEKSGNIWAPIFLHMLINFTAII